MIEKLHRALADAVRAAVKQRYEIELDAVVLERPPQSQLGDLATPLPFELARQLKRPPREIAHEIIEALADVKPVVPYLQNAGVAGGGYINFAFDRGEFFAGAVEPPLVKETATLDTRKLIVEHTNINPNKAAHVGHLRNAVLGDTFVRLLRYGGRRVEVQNYIDNTGVQVADVVVGFEHLEKKSLGEVEKLAAQKQPRLDFYCWDLYARVTQFYEEDKSRLELRAQALKAIEEGEGETARLAELVATTIVRCHLETMQRLGVQYDLLPRESEVLHLKFWEEAFAQLKERGAIEFAESGKNKGCWVMRTTGEDARATDARAPDAGPTGAAELDEAKIIVRSNGTVTYVGKDIAYQLWKFGLLGRSFAYRRFYAYPDGHTAWMSATEGERDAPVFGGAWEVYNVIDSRQSYLQNIVAAGVRALGYKEQAERSVHFSYEMVALTPRCARELGIELGPEEEKRAFVEVSGRKGQGVKADDLLDALEAAALREVAARHAQLPTDEQRALAHKIAVAALRFFLLRFTRNTVIAFDFKDALNFDGETGPYLQYSVVRARNIFRKLREAEPDYPLTALGSKVPAEVAGRLLARDKGDDLWELALTAAELERVAAIAAGQQEPAVVAKWAFGLAQQFNLFYHKHHILSESDAERKAFLLLLTGLFERQLTRALDLMGIEVPERM